MSPALPMWGRKASLLLVEGENALDLTEFRFTFTTQQTDAQSPNNCSIRVYNLAKETVSKIKGEYSRVVLQAGYESGAFGVIFDGTIRQHRVGKEGPLDTYLDILAADGDLAHNFGLVNVSVAAGSTPEQRIKQVTDAMNAQGVSLGYSGLTGTGGVLPRGKVLFGLPRAALNSETRTAGATWNISGGKVNIIPLDGYLPGEAVVLTSETGLIGRPEQTAEGIRVKCLLNPKIQPGTLLKIDEASIDATSNTSTNTAGIPYNQWAAPQFLADVTRDGLYRVIVAEFNGDSRGNAWYVDIIALAVNAVTNKVLPYG